MDGKIDKAVAVALGALGWGTVYHRRLRNADGTALRARVNGKAKTWKTRPDEWYLSLKYGLRDCFKIGPHDAHEWTTVEPSVEDVPHPDTVLTYL